MTARCSCGRRWDGLSQCHCGSCHAHFASLAGFDAHRKDGVCVEPGLLRILRGTRAGEPVLRPVDGPHGVTWHSGVPDDRWEQADAALPASPGSIGGRGSVSGVPRTGRGALSPATGGPR